MHIQLQEEHAKVIKLNENLEDEVERRTQDMRAIFQNIHLGIFTITRDMTVAPEYSKFMNEIFDDTNLANENPINLLHGCEKNSDRAAQDRAVVEQVLGENELNFVANAANLSTEIHRRSSNGDTKIIELNWQTIEREGVVDRLLVTAKDVTGERKVAEQAQAKTREIQMVGDLVQHPKEVTRRFFNNSEVLLKQNYQMIHHLEKFDDEALKMLFINAHTLKGLVRSLGLTELVDLIHSQESWFAELRDQQVTWDQDMAIEVHDHIAAVFELYKHVNDVILGRGQSNFQHVELRHDEIDKFVQLADAALSGREDPVTSLRHIRSGLMTKIYTRSGRVISENMEAVRLLAKDLKKPEPVIKIHDANIYVNEHGKEILSNVLTHLVRNSMDHGIESASVRERKGKAARGSIHVEMEKTNEDEIRIAFYDDGQGLHIELIKKIGMVKGLIIEAATSPETVANLIFEPDFSTAHKLTDISGRGVGMAAVRNFVEQQGGRISIILANSDSAEAGFQPFKVMIVLPYWNFFFTDQSDLSLLAS